MARAASDVRGRSHDQDASGTDAAAHAQTRPRSHSAGRALPVPSIAVSASLAVAALVTPRRADDLAQSATSPPSSAAQMSPLVKARNAARKDQRRCV